MIINASSLYVLQNSKPTDAISVWETLGSQVWFIGFLFEIIADS